MDTPHLHLSVFTWIYTLHLHPSSHDHTTPTATLLHGNTPYLHTSIFTWINHAHSHLPDITWTHHNYIRLLPHVYITLHHIWSQITPHLHPLVLMLIHHTYIRPFSHEYTIHTCIHPPSHGHITFTSTCLHMNTQQLHPSAFTWIHHICTFTHTHHTNIRLHMDTVHLRPLTFTRLNHTYIFK